MSCDGFLVRVLTPADPQVIKVVEPGPPGASVFGVWLANGNTGSVEDFLATLRGPPGAPGPGLSTLEIPQPVPATTWTLTHNLNRFPSVTLVDSAGDLFDSDTRYVDANTIVVTLNAPTSGTAYLN